MVDYVKDSTSEATMEVSLEKRALGFRTRRTRNPATTETSRRLNTMRVVIFIVMVCVVVGLLFFVFTRKTAEEKKSGVPIEHVSVNPETISEVDQTITLTKLVKETV
jgi:flagellar basal body-associated protein FliL